MAQSLNGVLEQLGLDFFELGKLELLTKATRRFFHAGSSLETSNRPKGAR